MWVASLLERLSAAGPFLLDVLLDAAIKGAAMLALTAVVTLAMRRACAAARHLVWLLGVLGLLILPVLSAGLPHLDILPRWVVDAPASVERAVAQVGSPDPAAVPALPDAPDLPAYVPPQAKVVVPVSSAPALPPLAPPSRLRLSWQAWILLGWLAGTVALLGQVALGFLSLWWLGHRSSRITQGAWPILLRQLCGQLGLRRPVELLDSPRRTMPMTWGLWRTRVLLPEGSVTWTAERRRTVLLHELAHARRWDCLTQLLVQVACALHWFNPLVWVAWRRIQTERERACDDLVLNTGTKASAYAEQLLYLASEMPAAHFSAAAIAMARPSKLEGRLLAILDTSRSRRTARAVVMLAGLLLAGAALPLAMLRAAEPATRPSANKAAIGNAEVVRREVNRKLADFVLPPDLSTPEGAWAAWQRANVNQDFQAIANDSLVKLDPEQERRWWQQVAREDPDHIYRTALADSKLIELWIYRDELAETICYLPFPEGKGRCPYSFRAFGLADGRWRNLGEDRCASLEEARQTIQSKEANMWADFQQLKPHVPMPAAATQSATQPARTATYRRYDPDRPGQWARVMVKDGRDRIEGPDGAVLIHNTIEGKGLYLDPKQKTATVSTFVNVRPDHLMFTVANLEKMAEPGTRHVVSLGREKIAGREADGIQFHVGGEQRTVWRDAVSGRPVQIETNVDRLPTTGKPFHIIYSDMVWDVPLDDSLFAIQAPPGYELKQGGRMQFENIKLPATQPATQPSGGFAAKPRTVVAFVHDGKVQMRVDDKVMVGDAIAIHLRVDGGPARRVIFDIDRGLVRMRYDGGELKAMGARIEVNPDGTVVAKGGLLPALQNAFESRRDVPSIQPGGF